MNNTNNNMNNTNNNINNTFNNNNSLMQNTQQGMNFDEKQAKGKKILRYKKTRVRAQIIDDNEFGD